MNAPATPHIAAIFRYPIKGLSAEPLGRIDLEPGAGVPLDRCLALALADSPFDPAHPVWLRKTHFLMLMRDERLATLNARYHHDERRIEIARDGQVLVEADLETPEGREELETFFQTYMDLAGRPRLAEAPGHIFTDDPEPLVSLLNLETVRAVEAAIGRPVDPARFRANLHLEGLPAWRELDRVGERIRVGSAGFEVAKRIDRCAATNVDPRTAARDLNLPADLRRHFGHIDCGILLRVVEAGSVGIGDPLRPAFRGG